MRAIVGPFHPHLEEALVRELLSAKSAAPLSPLLVIVPSDSLRRRLKILLSGERGLSFLNLYILTFYQLLLRLAEGYGGSTSGELWDDLLFEEALRQFIKARLPGTEAFSDLEDKARGCAALWQTLRDLRDGMVEPERALEALKEGYFADGEKEKLADLFVLFGAFLPKLKDLGIRDLTDLSIAARERIPAAPFLRPFRHIFYYGFYDLTQAQLDLFRAIAQAFPTTVFFPLVRGDPAWAFAERFYERYLQGLAAEERDLGQRPTGPQLDLFAVSDPLPELRVASCSGPRDELMTVAKEILRLVADEGIRFHEIGVVARSLEPYAPWIKVFSEHKIPITTSAEVPLLQYPLAKALLLLISLPARDYPRAQLVDLLSSPFFNASAFLPAEATPRPDLWDLLTRRLGITRGLEQWRRLERYLARGASLAQIDEEEEPSAISVSSEEIRIFWDLLSELYRDFSALPKEASWSFYADRWKLLIEKYLRIPREESRSEVEETILATLERLSLLDGVGKRISLQGFLETFQRWLERASLPLRGDANLKGVAVLDGMAARGIPFRVLFVVGLNEGMFPRTIREDAFLRDRSRRVLETVLGYKVGEKLSGFDEEKLLLSLLVSAAQERLYCLYQRSDESGRALAPSWYLTELRRTLKPASEVTIPRGILEKNRAELFGRGDLLLPGELAIRLSLEGEDPTPLVDRFSSSPALYRRALRALTLLDSAAEKLAPCDGIVGELPEFWHRLLTRGISPTALELYGLCPFRFFARSVLGLKKVERPEELEGPSPSELGALVHAILKSFYQKLIDLGVFKSQDSSFIDPRSLLEELARGVFAEFEEGKPVGYPAAWESLKEELTDLLAEAVTQDLAELSRSGYVPVAVEFEARKRLGDDWPQPASDLTIRGRIDRIDHLPKEGRYRVVDYKLKWAARSPEERNLRRSALRGQKLQAPFYLLLARDLAGGEKPPQARLHAEFYYLCPRSAEGPLARDSVPEEIWLGETGRELKKTVSFLLNGIYRGRFFVRPGRHCRRCEVSEVCRKNHPPTRWRVENDRAARLHRELGTKNPGQEPWR